MQDGREIAIDRDLLGFMELRAVPAAGTHIELQYRGTGEQKIMAALSAAAWIAAIAAWGVLWRKRSALTKTN